MSLNVGTKIKVRGGYTVQLGGDVFQGGEILDITAKNVPDLEKQEWKFELVSENKKEVEGTGSKIEKEGKTEKEVEGTGSKIENKVKNRAILDNKRNRLQGETDIQVKAEVKG